MGMGVANKVVLEFRTSFWREIEARPTEWINYASNQIGECPFFMNVQFYYQTGCYITVLILVEMPVLVAFLSTKESHQFEKVDDNKVIQHCLSILFAHLVTYLNGYFTEVFWF